MKPRIVLALPFAVLALVLAACGGSDGDGGSNGGGGDVTVVATEFEFDPSGLTISADTPTEITVDNQGVVEHDLTIDELGVHIHADAGESTTGTVTAAAGTYEFYCSVPGHRDSGMEGTLTVTG